MVYLWSATALCAAGALSCNLKRETVTVEPHRSASQASAAAPSPPPEPATISFSISAAVFEGDQLVECFDVSVDGKAPDGGMFDEAKAQNALFAGMFPKKSAKAKVTRLKSACTSQFKDRQPFGSCTATGTPDGGPGTVTFRDYWHSFGAVFQDDHLMKECIETGGSWEAISRDSDLFRLSKMEFEQAKLMRQLKKHAPGMVD